MHELSIAQNLLDIALRECRKSGHLKIESLTIRIGKASGVMPDALLFAFDALKAGTPAEGSTLAIEEMPVTGECSDCGGSFASDEEYVLRCPLCQGGVFSITGGRELDFLDMEVS